MPCYYVVRYRREDDLTEEQMLLPKEIRVNIIKRKYRMFLDAIPYYYEEWKETIRTFMTKETMDIAGLYRIFEVNFNEQYGEEVGRMIWEGEIYEFL